jgi:hypothetical protein
VLHKQNRHCSAQPDGTARHRWEPTWTEHAGRRIDVIEDRPQRRLHLRLRLLGDLGDHVAAAADQTPLAQALGELGLQRGDQARGAVGDTQQWRA